MADPTTEEATMPPPDTEAPERQPFAAVLQQMRKGGLHTEMGDELADLVVKCMDTQKKGAITLTLSVHPKGDIVEISDTVAVKTPRGNVLASHFWPDANGNLSLNNPAQMHMGELREVKGAAEKPRDLKELG